MSQILSAALSLAGVTLAFLFLAILASRRLRGKSAPKAPQSTAAARPLRNIKPPKLPRRNRAMEAPVEIAPSRLARISGKAPIDPVGS